MQLQSLPKFLPIAFAFILSANALHAQLGTLDPTFGTGGKVLTPMQGGDKLAIQALIVQPDGKLVGAGYTGVGKKC